MKIYIVLAAALALVGAQHTRESASREESHEKSHEEELKPLVRCKRVECRMFCEHGFQTDHNGCPTCKCMENECKDKVCPENEQCVATIACEKAPCTSLKAECVRPPPCAMPMCNMEPCPFGLKADRFGCERCECKESPDKDCDQHPVCPSNHKCHMIRTPFCPPGQRCGSRPMCLPIGHEDNFHPHGKEPRTHDGIEEGHFPQPPTGGLFAKLCVFRQSFADSLLTEAKKQFANSSALYSFLGSRALHRPLCKENGEFQNMQCHFPDRQCWCVDDRGGVLSGTTKDVRSREDLPQCIPHKTLNLDGTFMLKHELEDVHRHIEHIKGIVHEHLSKMLLMDKEFIIITKVEAKATKENVISIEFSIHHDGKTDMTALERKLLWHFHQEHASIPFMSTFLQPQPTSLKINHYPEPMLPEEHGEWREERMSSFKRFYIHHKIAVLAGGIVGGGVLLIIIVAVTITACKRRKMSVQFQHKRMTEKSDKYKQNLAYANEISGGVDIKGEKYSKPDEENVTA